MAVPAGSRMTRRASLRWSSSPPCSEQCRRGGFTKGQVWSSQCRSLCLQPKASPVQKSGLDGRRNGDRPGRHLAEQGERRQQRESREQRLDPLACPCQDKKCKRRVGVRL